MILEDCLFYIHDITVVNSWLLHKILIVPKTKIGSYVEKPIKLSTFKEEDLAVLQNGYYLLLIITNYKGGCKMTLKIHSGKNVENRIV